MSRRGASTTPAAHSGRFTRNTAGHPAVCTSTPPSSQPDAPPAAAAAVHHATARRRGSGSENVAASSANAAGASIAAPMPCTARAATSAVPDGASPQASDAPPNTISPTWNSRRRPNRSAARPAATSRPPNVNA